MVFLVFMKYYDMRKRKRCFFRFRVSKGLSHGPTGRGVDCLGYETAKQS